MRKHEIVNQIIKNEGLLQADLYKFFKSDDPKMSRSKISLALSGSNDKVLALIINYLIENRGYELEDFDENQVNNREVITRLTRLEKNVEEIKKILKKIIKE